jgi:ferrous iron transport protein A
MLRKWFIACWPGGGFPFASTPATQENLSWVSRLVAFLGKPRFQTATVGFRLHPRAREKPDRAVRPTQAFPLSSLAPGLSAMVVEIKLEPAHRPRLMEMGLLVGTRVQLVRFAPLGDPIEIKLRGYHLSLRKTEADRIWVSPHPAD